MDEYLDVPILQWRLSEWSGVEADFVNSFDEVFTHLLPKIDHYEIRRFNGGQLMIIVRHGEGEALGIAQSEKCLALALCRAIQSAVDKENVKLKEQYAPPEVGDFDIVDIIET